MSRKFVVAVLPLAVLTVGLPRAVAGPPQGVSGRMVVDEVADWLLAFRKAKGRERRMLILLWELGEKRNDPRVKVMLGETLDTPSPDVRFAAATQFLFCRGLGMTITSDAFVLMVREIWQEQQADLRRRAARLAR
jgi:hypothetical protein